MIRLFKEVIKSIIFQLNGEIGYKLRRTYWGKRLKYLGRDVFIEPNVIFNNPQWITISDNCWIDRNAIITGGAKTEDSRKTYSDIVQPVSIT